MSGLPSPHPPQLPVGLPQADVPLSTVTGGVGSPQELTDFECELGISPHPLENTRTHFSQTKTPKIICALNIAFT